MAKNGSYQSLYNAWTLEPFATLYIKNEAVFVTVVAGFDFINVIHILTFRCDLPLRPEPPQRSS
jgi:hypothetical protein